MSGTGPHTINDPAGLSASREAENKTVHYTDPENPHTPGPARRNTFFLHVIMLLTFT